MDINLDRLRSKRKIYRLITIIGRLADQRGVVAYVVGGCVRDIILGREILDLDIVVEGDALTLAKTVGQNEKAILRRYPQFKTASLQFADGLRVDFATARKEIYSVSGALPVVSPGTISDDLFRRDFTINAIAVRINRERLGQCVDPYGGLNDIKKKKIRVLQEQSFVDDPTRILRAIRFEQRFHFSVERKTLQLLEAALQANVAKNVKPPRYFNEFRKILKEPNPCVCFERLQRLGGLDFLLEGFSFNARLLQKIHHGRQKLRRKDFYKNIFWDLLYLMGVTFKMIPRDLENLIEKFQLTKLEKDALRDSQDVLRIVQQLRAKKLSDSQVYQILKSCDDLVIIFIRLFVDSPTISRRVDKFIQELKFVKLQITGDDLKEMGFGEGKAVGRILEDILLKKLDGKIKNHREEIFAAKQFFATTVVNKS